ncbi:hypothetical protein ACFXOM_12905 [Streptomyces sp. NPDC059169]|uniref:hypothetical protein n=1 Tax=Streptomyces sp. NPDC059169 TaxID=3346754 RepID=UPI00367B45FE
MEYQLVLATWGLFVATALLFVVTAIPAIGQFLDWRNKKRALASSMLPVLHGIKNQVSDLRDMLLRLEGNQGDIELYDALHSHVEGLCDRVAAVQDEDGVSIEQRLELYVLSSHLNFMGLQLALLSEQGGASGGDEQGDEQGDTEMADLLSEEERGRRAVASAQASLVSLDRLDRLFAGIGRRSKGRTFTEEMMRRVEGDTLQAQKDLVDLRHAKRRSRQTGG